MSEHLQKEIDRLKKRTLSLSTLVEENVARAVRAFSEKDGKLARRVIEMDMVIDTLEIEVEEECLKILALHQPVAVDLRFIVAVLKMKAISSASAILPSTSPNARSRSCGCRLPICASR